jgi:hypothetical protein
MDQDMLEDILVTPQIDPAHRSGFVQMSKRPLQEFTPAALQSFAALCADPPSVAIHSVARVGIFPPVSPPPIGLEM